MLVRRPGRSIVGGTGSRSDFVKQATAAGASVLEISARTQTVLKGMSHEYGADRVAEAEEPGFSPRLRTSHGHHCWHRHLTLYHPG
ncbi:MAG: hypothetical protein IPM93_19950 [Candidatus Obscuribacter sp.]|nr:hypothetical protein [Candidatus Obscuribacter sp.]